MFKYLKKLSKSKKIIAIFIVFILLVTLGGLIFQKSYAEEFTGASGTSGNCSWTITAAGKLTIKPSSDSSSTEHRTKTKAIDVRTGDTTDSMTLTATPNSGTTLNLKMNNITKTFTSGTSSSETITGSNGTVRIDYDGTKTFNFTLTSGTLVSYDVTVTYTITTCTLEESPIDYNNIPWYEYRSSITSVRVEPGVRANAESRYLFYDLSNATTIDVSNLNTSNVTNMYYMFRNCSSLTELDLSNFNTENVTNMGCMFYNCSSLIELDLSNFNTSNVTDMSFMFLKCSSLIELDLSNFNTSNVTDMSGMFRYCYALKVLNLSSFDMDGVTHSYMFLNIGRETSNGCKIILNKYFNWIYSTDPSDGYFPWEYWAQVDSNDNIIGTIKSLSDMKNIVVGSETPTTWVPAYTVTYNKNNGTSIYGSPNPQIYRIGENIDTTGYKAIKTDYLFNKWNTKTDNSGTTIPLGVSNVSYGSKYDSTGLTKGNIVLYPQFIKNISNPTISEGTTKIYGDEEQIKLTCNENTEVSEGSEKYYSFGYSTKENEKPTIWTEESTDNELELDTDELFNRYYKCNVYIKDSESGNQSETYTSSNKANVKVRMHKVTFNANGGTLKGDGELYGLNDPILYKSDIGKRGTEVTQMTYAESTNPQLSFIGWYTETGDKVLNPDGSIAGKVNGYTNTNSWALTDDVELFAKFKEGYTVKYVGSGGIVKLIEGQEIGVNNIISDDKDVIAPHFSPNGRNAQSNKSGETLKGWICNKTVVLKDGTEYKVIEGQNHPVIPRENFTKIEVTDNIECATVFDANAYSLTYRAINGEVEGDNVVKNITYGSKIVSPTNIRPYEGYTLDHWTIDHEVAIYNGDEIEKTIPAGSPISKTELNKIKVLDNYTITAVHIKENKLGQCTWKIENNVLKLINETNTESCTLDPITENSQAPWMSNKDSITSIEVSPGVKANVNSSNLFSNLPNVTSIDVSNLDTTGVTNMSHMFENDQSLTNIIFKKESEETKWNTSDVTDMTAMFKNDTSLTTIDLTNFDLSSINHMDEMFSGCSNLSNINVNEKLDIPTASTINNMFEKTTLTPEEIKEIFNFSEDMPKPKIDDNIDTNKTVSEEDLSNGIIIDKPENGSGKYSYEIASELSGVELSGDKIIFPENTPPGEYSVIVNIKDEITGKISDDIIYTIIVTNENTPVLSVTNPEKVYGSSTTKLTCIETTVKEGFTKYYKFGYIGTDETIWDSEDTTDNEKTLEDFIGTKNYVCGIYFKKGEEKTEVVQSNPVTLKISNASITFNEGEGTISGNSEVIRYTHKNTADLYTEKYSEIKTNVPVATKTGHTFIGWYNESGQKILNANGTFVGEISGYTTTSAWAITEPITLIANYTKNEEPSDDDQGLDDTGYYGKVANIKAYLKTYKDVTLSFSKANGATGYRVCYKKASESNYKCNDKGTIGGINLAVGTKYNFRVAPYKKINGKLYVSPNGTVTSIYTLKKMNKPKVKKATSKKVKVTLTKMNGATGYELYTSKKKNKGYKKVKTVGSNITSFKMKAAKKKKTYYKIRAYKIENGKRIYAPFSKVKKYTLK